MADVQDPRDIPVIDPPPGVKSNFENPDSLHAVTLGIGVVSILIMSLVVGIRTYTKLVLLKNMAHEDCSSSHPQPKS
jgi:hypothetical protein